MSHNKYGKDKINDEKYLIFDLPLIFFGTIIASVFIQVFFKTVLSSLKIYVFGIILSK